jgi:hypothetical protein
VYLHVEMDIDRQIAGLGFSRRLLMETGLPMETGLGRAVAIAGFSHSLALLMLI